MTTQADWYLDRLIDLGLDADVACWSLPQIVERTVSLWFGCGDRYGDCDGGGQGFDRDNIDGNDHGHGEGYGFMGAGYGYGYGDSIGGNYGRDYGGGMVVRRELFTILGGSRFYDGLPNEWQAE